MGTIVTDSKHYENIASTIREKTGSEETYTPEEMTAGVNEVYDKGRTDEWQKWWDTLTGKGTRKAYNYFRAELTEENEFNPPYKIFPVNPEYMFIRNAGIKSLGKQYLDMSQVTRRYTAFVNNCTNLEIIEDINFNGNYEYYQSFAYCAKLHTIERLPVSETLIYKDTFHQCSSLKNITIDGVIGNNISFKHCPLSVESMKSIISHLNNYAGTDKEFAYTVAFSSACLTLLEAEGNTSPNGNTWRQYAQDLGWNC